MIIWILGNMLNLKKYEKWRIVWNFFFFFGFDVIFGFDIVICIFLLIMFIVCSIIFCFFGFVIDFILCVLIRFCCVFLTKVVFVDLIFVFVVGFIVIMLFCGFVIVEFGMWGISFGLRIRSLKLSIMYLIFFFIRL